MFTLLASLAVAGIIVGAAALEAAPAEIAGPAGAVIAAILVAAERHLARKAVR